MAGGGTRARSFAPAAAIVAGVAFCLLATAPAGAATDDRDRPLGTLIYPNPGPAPAPSRDGDYGRSALDDPLPAQPSPAFDAAPAGLPEKPLGTLIAPQPGAAPAAPAAPLSSPLGSAVDATSGVRRPLAPTPLPGQYRPLGDRPLGTLISPSLSRPAATRRPAAAEPEAPSSPGPADAAPVPRRPQRTATSPAPDPRGAPQPQPQGETRTAGSSSNDRAPSPQARPQSGGETPASDGGDGEVQGKQPVDFSADSLTYDRELGIITARGDVVIVNEGQRLIADVVTYNQNTDVVTARGNVVMFEPSGEEVYADYVEVTGDLKDGVIRDIGVILQDHSRLAAAGGRRSGGNLMEMRKAVYSPCNLCPDDPDAPPLWQIKAVQVIHNKEEQIVQYRDAWLEVAGVPVAYTPFFQHPDPTVKRRSGLLAPSIGSSSDLGAVLKTPYYWNIDPYSDATLTPLITTEEGSGLITEYRQNFARGEVDATGSLVVGDSEEDVRGHIRGEANFDIDRTWRWGARIDRASDDTYLRRYGFSSDNALTSRLYTEGFRGRNYFVANGYTFQGMEAGDDQAEIPVVLPMLDYSHVGRPGLFGGHTVLDANMLVLTRERGTDVRRLSLRPGWELPFDDALGGRYNLGFKLKADGYHVTNVARDGQDDFTGVTGRVVPEAKLDWRMPFVRPSATVDQIIEPIASFVVSPYGGNPDEIPNEDSQELEFDDTNLFSANRFSGIDRVEGGPRLNYGVKWGVYGKGGGSTSVLVGQTYRPRVDDTYAAGSGLDDELSDVVTRVDINPGKWVDLLYRTQFDPADLNPSRNEVQATVGAPAFQVSTNYIYLEPQADSEFEGREELKFNVSSQINRYWRTGFTAVQDIDASEARSMTLHATYEDECIAFRATIERSFYEDRDLEPTDSIFFRVLLKTLGEFETGGQTIQ